MKMEKIRIILITLFGVMFFISASMMIRQQIQYQKIIANSEEAAKIAGLQEVSNYMETSIQPEIPQNSEISHLSESAAALAGIDLEALRAINEDIVGWIEIPGTDLSYPLTQGTDNQYYLSHNWKGEASSGGSVFLECKSSPDLTDYHTIIYAHRMRNDTMFGILRYYEEIDFWREHPDFYVAVNDGVYHYSIFSAQEVSADGIVYRLDMTESHLEKEFIQYCTENSVFDTEVIPEPADHILTLSTCTGRGHTARWVVHGVLREIFQRRHTGR